MQLENGRRHVCIHKAGLKEFRPQRQPPSNNPDTVVRNLLENNGTKCLWWGHLAQPTDHLMLPPKRLQ